MNFNKNTMLGICLISLTLQGSHEQPATDYFTKFDASAQKDSWLRSLADTRELSREDRKTVLMNADQLQKDRIKISQARHEAKVQKYQQDQHKALESLKN